MIKFVRVTYVRPVADFGELAESAAEYHTAIYSPPSGFNYRTFLPAPVKVGMCSGSPVYETVTSTCERSKVWLRCVGKSSYFIVCLVLLSLSIWALRHIRRVLPQDVAKTLASSIVSSRLDYCNAVLYGTPNSTTSKLQKVQNCLARVVLQQRKFCHAQPLLKLLHKIFQYLSESTSNWQLWLSIYCLLHNPNTFIS